MWKRLSEERPESETGFRRSMIVQTMGYIAFATVIGREIHMVYSDGNAELEGRIFNYGDRIEWWMLIPPIPDEQTSETE